MMLKKIMQLIFLENDLILLYPVYFITFLYCLVFNIVFEKRKIFFSAIQNYLTPQLKIFFHDIVA